MTRPEEANMGHKVGESLIACHFLWKLKHLPRVKIGPTSADTSKPIGFTFDGGRGCVMGMLEG